MKEKKTEEWNLKFSDLFRGIEFHDDAVAPEISIPDSFYQRMQDYFMERGYLNDIGDKKFISLKELSALESQYGQINWLRITHLPVNPSNDDKYDLLSRWQSVLATMHIWNYRLLFLLLRQDGETHLYLGTAVPLEGFGTLTEEAVEQLRQAMHGSMPGIGADMVQDVYSEIIRPLSKMPNVGGLTGIPSFRKAGLEKNLQTLDSLAFGIKDKNGLDRDYALLIIADPIKDGEINDLISRMRELGSQIHSDVNRTVSMQRSAQDGKSKSAAAGTALREISHSLMYMLPHIAGAGAAGTAAAGAAAAGTAAAGTVALPAILAALAVGSTFLAIKSQKNISKTSSGSISTEYLDKFAQAAEELTDQHVERFKSGRNLGFWNAGVYVLGSPGDIRTVTGMLRSTYSGENSYLEPIRTHLFDEHSGAKDLISGFELLPLISPDKVEDMKKYTEKNGAWHLFGKNYQYISTPVNTEELSLLTSLPRRDVPGLRFVKTAVRFASNPSNSDKDTICLGKMVDMGVPQGTDYQIDPDLLVRHALITGVTGCGKSTTCKNILSELMNRDVPILVIEPAKDDYVRWAMEKNKTLPPEKQIRVYMPGTSKNPDIRPLQLNLFEPAAVKGARADMLQHSENMSMLLNACLPSEDVVPILIDETVHRVMQRFTTPFDPCDMERPLSYPRVLALLACAEEIMEKKSYDEKVKSNLKEILMTRFTYLTRGTRGKVFDVNRSIDYEEVFSHPTVINLSNLAGSKEKALVMSLLLLALYEYRASAYQNDEEYRKKAQANKLMHFTLVEEAHNVIAKVDGSPVGDPRVAASDLFSNILSEIRGYGEGIGIVDQVPTRLLPDAIKNTNLKICHRIVAPDDCEVMASGLALRPDQKTLIPALEVGNAIVCGDMDDAAIWVKMKLSDSTGRARI